MIVEYYACLWATSDIRTTLYRILVQRLKTAELYFFARNIFLFLLVLDPLDSLYRESKTNLMVWNSIF